MRQLINKLEEANVAVAESNLLVDCRLGLGDGSGLGDCSGDGDGLGDADDSDDGLGDADALGDGCGENVCIHWSCNTR